MENVYLWASRKTEEEWEKDRQCLLHLRRQRGEIGRNGILGDGSDLLDQALPEAYTDFLFICIYKFHTLFKLV